MFFNLMIHSFSKPANILLKKSHDLCSILLKNKDKSIIILYSFKRK